ncbi:4-diphosphocytidyl-2C-methyl-D-erythritol synthase [Georgfuchsia toluolica]|uniref:2-C-methyl-D-erythritol 4-phosphate cytidylyltransferase n=1 Tax=Georgfuchsia toluolica TaxID=424218 RepID=A0A916N7W0_9PROT|nr:2-C-methyl-D-erythritol 4-phosphate cytidylyltransferase [Georgfuchsia toluolica]CAG4882578.1 4-diphosphocytidyl-2C-methyl-D-erythritol synthase [Georgfuchsia toluolica]
MNDGYQYFALVPAAGSGSRMGKALSKQYLPLAGRPLIAHALETLCAVARIKAVFVVLAPVDDEWLRHDWSVCGDKLVPLFCGGATRAESVANGLRAMSDRVKADDWVLVHDAARPCITPAHIEALLHAVGDDPVGGILAQPVADTLKRADSAGRIEATVARTGLWQAQTPQMFRHGMLLRALTQNAEVTDEAGAIEALGQRPRLVAGDASNLKVTWPQDLQLAEWILKARNHQ